MTAAVFASEPQHYFMDCIFFLFHVSVSLYIANPTWRPAGGALLTYFPTFVPEFKNAKIPNSPCRLGGTERHGVIDLFSNFCSRVKK